MGFDEGIPNDRFLWKGSRQLHWYVSLQLCQQHPVAKLRMLGFFLLFVSQDVLSCPSSAGNISCMLQLKFKRKKMMKMFLPDVRNSQLHQERFSHIADWWEATDAKWRSKENALTHRGVGWRDGENQREDNFQRVKPFCCCIVLLNLAPPCKTLPRAWSNESGTACW